MQPINPAVYQDIHYFTARVIGAAKRTDGSFETPTFHTGMIINAYHRILTTKRCKIIDCVV